MQELRYEEIRLDRLAFLIAVGAIEPDDPRLCELIERWEPPRVSSFIDLVERFLQYYDKTSASI